MEVRMNFKYLFIIVVCVNVLLFLAQVGADKINPDSSSLYTYEGSFMQGYDAGDFTLNQNSTGIMPSSEGSVSPTTGNLFTDVFASIKNWFTDSTGGRYFTALLWGIPNILKSTGMPSEVVFALGVLWNALAVISFIVFLKGG
jgi:hypothetical protein